MKSFHCAKFTARAVIADQWGDFFQLEAYQVINKHLEDKNRRESTSRSCLLKFNHHEATELRTGELDVSLREKWQELATNKYPVRCLLQARVCTCVCFKWTSSWIELILVKIIDYSKCIHSMENVTDYKILGFAPKPPCWVRCAQLHSSVNTSLIKLNYFTLLTK